MSTEIERKFLVKNSQWKESVISESRMKQGYLANQRNASIRIRIAKGKARLTVKGATTGISRPEFEYEVPLQDAETMLDQVAEKPLIEKTRYRVQSGTHVWDLDVFSGENAGLIIAEVELESEEEKFEIPSWTGDEVSSDPRYYNASLVKHPFKRW